LRPEKGLQQEPAVPARAVLPTLGILDAVRMGSNKMLTDPAIWF